ncbi:hypothetical protein [Chondrinema litorale]|uniref:hypothetical protein n=1 Tax=Chondrinema litorale TaxID=2994555 RepID=UPI002543CA21|nr:hypothetical protein [Chondrinema litorale]UZR97682.1 hypothetical protein OQ292_28155 [Chondrinema litorale]
MTQINLTITKLSFLLKILFLGLIIFGCEDDESVPVKTEYTAIYPPNGADDVALGFWFDWKLLVDDGITDVGGQSLSYNYQLLIGTHPDEMVVVDTNIYHLTHAESKALELNTTYYWQIRTKKDGEYLNDSEIYDFKTTSSLQKVELPQKKLMVYPADFTPETFNIALIAYQFGAFDLIDGSSNTEIIVKYYADLDVDELFRQVTEYCYTLDAYGYDDWYLPAIVELDSVTSQLHLLDSLGDNFEYWSSTEVKDKFLSVYLKAHKTYPDEPYLIQQKSQNPNSRFKCRCVREAE